MEREGHRGRGGGWETLALDANIGAQDLTEGWSIPFPPLLCFYRIPHTPLPLPFLQPYPLLRLTLADHQNLLPPLLQRKNLWEGYKTSSCKE
jgi:hypothetical protein